MTKRSRVTELKNGIGIGIDMGNGSLKVSLVSLKGNQLKVQIKIKKD